MEETVLESGDDRQKLLEFVLDSLSVCESRGYLQLTISLPQLREKLEELWNEQPSPVENDGEVFGETSAGHLSPVLAVEETGERGVTGREVEGSNCDGGDICEAGAAEIVEEEVRKEQTASNLPVDEDVEDKVEERGEVREGERDREEGEEEGECVVVDEVLEEEGSLADMNWTILTPDVSCLLDAIVTPDLPEDEEQQQATCQDSCCVETENKDEREEETSTGNESSPDGSVNSSVTRSSDTASCGLRDEEMSLDTSPTSSQLTESVGGEMEGEEGGGFISGLPYTHPRWSDTESAGLSPAVPPLTQPNFDDLSSSASSVADVSLPALPHPLSLPQTPSSTYFTTPPSPPPTTSVSVYHTARLPPPSPPSRSRTPSPPLSHQTPTPSTHHSPSPPPHTSLHSPPSSHITISSSPPSHTHTSVIVLDSSDEEEADDKLDNLFSQMRLQSEKRKMASEKVSSRKSLSEFIVSDSEGESEEEEEEEEQPVCDIEPVSNFETPSGPPSRSQASLTPHTPHSSLHLWMSPTPRSHSHTLTAPPKGVYSRHPLTEHNHSPHRPGVRTEVKAKAPVSTPSAHKTFSRNKKVMARELYSLFNHSVFGDQLAPDMELVWNSKLRTTAGFCRNRGLMNNRQSQIELSTKVIDSYERLKNTLIHEMCHAAVWIINGIKDGGHKRHWRAWASKANSVHPDLEPITRCHSYDITYKFHYKCTRCDYKLGRHSKSVNLTDARCPYCLSVLKLDGPPPSKINRYAQFVKDHYSEVKLRTPGGHRAVMEKLREQYYSTCPHPQLEEK